jgi:hypothetical protein
MFLSKVKSLTVLLLLVGILGAGLGLLWPTGQPKTLANDGAKPAPEGIARNLPENVRGQKVLLAFGFYENAARGQRSAKADDVRAALKKAGVELVEAVTEEEKSEPIWRYEALLLLNCKDKALAGLPCRKGGIVFRDGNYHEGLANDNPESGEKKNQVPANYAWQPWGIPQLMSGQKDKDLERFRKIGGVAVEYVPPPPLTGGGAGWGKLTPEAGKRTLLEVFLLSKAGFRYVDPSEVPRKGGKASEPAVNDGLSVTVTPTKAIFGPDEYVKVELTYKNTSQRAFRLRRPGEGWRWGYTIEDVAAKELLKTDRWTNTRDLIGKGWYQDFFPTLKPGEALTVAMERRFLTAKGADLGLGKYPPGKYRAVIHIRFEENPRGGADKDNFQGNKADYWFGEITTKPVEFEIADKPK